MALALVAYDLKRPGQDYPDLIKKLESYPRHWHMQQSVWLVTLSGSEYDLANELEGYLDENDKLFVTRVSSSAAWSGYSEKVSEWLHRNL